MRYTYQGSNTQTFNSKQEKLIWYQSQILYFLLISSHRILIYEYEPRIEVRSGNTVHNGGDDTIHKRVAIELQSTAHIWLPKIRVWLNEIGKKKTTLGTEL